MVKRMYKYVTECFSVNPKYVNPFLVRPSMDLSEFDPELIISLYDAVKKKHLVPSIYDMIIIIISYEYLIANKPLPHVIRIDDHIDCFERFGMAYDDLLGVEIYLLYGNPVDIPFNSKEELFSEIDRIYDLYKKGLHTLVVDNVKEEPLVDIIIDTIIGESGISVTHGYNRVFVTPDDAYTYKLFSMFDY